LTGTLSAFSAEEPAGKPFLVLETGAHQAAITQVLFTPGSEELITVSLDKTVRIWETSSGQLLRTIRLPVGPGPEGELHAAVLSKDGKVLAVGCHGVAQDGKQRNSIFLLNPQTGEILRPLTSAVFTVRALALSGNVLAAGSDGPKIQLWDIETGKYLKSLDGHKGGTHGLAFSPDGSQLASVGNDKVGRIWSVADGKVTAELKGDKTTSVWHTVAWSPDGQAIATGLWEGHSAPVSYFAVWTPHGKLARRVHHEKNRLMAVDSLAFTPDSTGILEAGSDEYLAFVTLWDTRSGKQRKEFFYANHHHEEAARAPAVVSPNGKLVAVAGDRHHRTYLYGIGGKRLRTFGGKGRQITEVAWVKGKEQPAEIVWRTDLTPQREEKVKIKNITAKYFQRAFELEQLRPAAVPTDASFRLHQHITKDVRLSVWGTELFAHRDGKPKLEMHVPASRDKQWIAVATLVGPDRAAVAQPGRGLFLLNTHTGRLVHRLHGPHGNTNAAAPSPDGKYLLAAGDDQVLRFWDLKNAYPLLSLFVVGGDWIAWTEEGYYAASPGGERLMGWQINNGYDQPATVHPAARFRKALHRPEIIAHLLEAGSLAAALKKAEGDTAAPRRVVDVLPPRVRLLAPAARRLELKQPRLEVTAEAQGRGSHPVTALQLLLDGRPYEGDKSLRPVSAKPGETTSARWQVEIPDGKHQLSVAARSAVSSAVSDELEVTWAPPVPPAPPDVPPTLPALHVLAIGIDKYPGPLELRCAVRDATKLEKTFRDFSSPLFAVQSQVLADQQARREDILAGLDRLRQKMQPQDVAVIFYAGHGERDSKGNFYLLPHDVDPGNVVKTGITGAELKQKLANIKGKIVLLLDACHSGQVGKVINELARDLADDDCGVIVFCAALGSEYAGESPKLGHGFFCLALMEGLAGKGEKNRRDGRVYLHDLEHYVIDRVIEMSRDEQHPTSARPTMRPFALSKP
jgi:WD40 repeat protein